MKNPESHIDRGLLLYALERLLEIKEEMDRDPNFLMDASVEQLLKSHILKNLINNVIDPDALVKLFDSMSQAQKESVERLLKRKGHLR